MIRILGMVLVGGWLVIGAGCLGAKRAICLSYGENGSGYVKGDVMNAGTLDVSMNGVAQFASFSAHWDANPCQPMDQPITLQ